MKSRFNDGGKFMVQQLKNEKYNPIVPVIHGCGFVSMRDNDGKLIECDTKD